MDGSAAAIDLAPGDGCGIDDAVPEQVGDLADSVLDAAGIHGGEQRDAAQRFLVPDHE